MRFLLNIGLFLFYLSAYAYPPQQENTPPNIILILADDLGLCDINSFDPLQRSYYETPNIDKLAAEGMKFTQAYTNAANCSPTRAALLSGQYYPHQPVYHVGDPHEGRMIPAPNAHALPAEKITIAEALKTAGYATALIGKWHIGEPPATNPEQQGFDVNIGGYNAGNPGNWEGGYFQPNNNPHIRDAEEGEYLTDYLTRKAIGFVEAHQEMPFYLHLSYYTPHSPFQAPEHLVEKYKQKQGENGHSHPTYAAMLESLDTNVGLLMQKLDELDMAENTLLIFYSDNGGRGGYDYLGRADNNITDNKPLKGGKTTFYEGGIRVPLALRWPAVIEPGAHSNEPVTSIDFYPTFLEMAGLEKPKGYVLDGLSLVPLFKNPDASLTHRPLYWHFPGYPNNPWRTGPVSVIRDGDWKLLKFYETNQIELYNLSQDMSESENLALKKPKTCATLRDELEAWLIETNAPMPKIRQNNTHD